MLVWVWENRCTLGAISFKDNLLVSVKIAKSYAIGLNNLLHRYLSYIYTCIHAQCHIFETIYCSMVYCSESLKNPHHASLGTDMYNGEQCRQEKIGHWNNLSEPLFIKIAYRLDETKTF